MKAYVVETEALRNNIRVVLEQACGVPVWAVLKGNGYGLGLLPFAKILREEGIEHFAVTEVTEAEQLRSHGFATEPILMLRATCDRATLEEMLDLNVIATIGSYEDAVALNGIAEQRGAMAEAHLELDTGMGRYGFSAREFDKVLDVYNYMSSIAVTGVYTHFHSAFSDKDATQQQFTAFRALLGRIQAQNLEVGMVHCCNSSALFKYPEMKLDAVRVGSAFLGRLSFRARTGLQKVGYAEAPIEEFHWLQRGDTCGYGAGWRAKRTTRVAVVNLGYYNGFGVEKGRDLFRIRDCIRGMLSNLKAMLTRKAIYVEVAGHRCRVLGHIGMVHTCIDVTDLSCSVGDPVRMEVNPLLAKELEIKYR
jgi:alanine racemase